MSSTCLPGPAQAKGLELVAIVDERFAAGCQWRPGRLRQVVTNLIGNAIKFTQAGEIVVRVLAPDFDGTDALIRFEVSDTGEGIAPDKLALVFQPFVQGGMSTPRKFGGTGLGLAISAQLVALMGGDSGVTSQVAMGSTFWFTIRVRVDNAQTKQQDPLRDAGLVGVNVLVVDDNAAQRSVLSEKLNDWGMIVATAASGSEALAMMRTAAAEDRAFAVALIDRSMPGMDGLQLKDAIVGDAALTSRLILMTGLGQELHTGDVDLVGICASLSKPVHRENLRSCLHIALGLQPADTIPRMIVEASRDRRPTPAVCCWPTTTSST